jgi:hypothetical protein
MAKGKKGTTKVGMPWWAQHTEEILTNQILRSCFPKGKWLEGLGLYITLKALVSAQYNSEKEDCTTFEVRHTYLIGLLEHSITQETLEEYLQAMLKKKVLQHIEVSEDSSIIRLDRIKDELDNWTKRTESAKQKAIKSEEKVKEENEKIPTPFDDDESKNSISEETTEKLHPTVHNNTSHNITKHNKHNTDTKPIGLVRDSNSIEDEEDYITVDSDSSILKFKHIKTGAVIDITDSDIISDHSLTKQEKITKQIGRNLK